MEIPTIEIATVKVMRSHDYCHFEVSLSSSGAKSPEAVDELRKQAARLADKAVRQYRIAKINAQRLASNTFEQEQRRMRVQRIREINEEERTVEQRADLKAWDDEQYALGRGSRYDYQDDWEYDEDQDS